MRDIPEGLDGTDSYGVLLGVSGGYILRLVLRRLDADTALYPVVVLLGSLLLFGATQSVGASGFIAVEYVGRKALSSGARFPPRIHCSSVASTSRAIADRASRHGP